MDRPRIKLNAQIYEEASAWFIECRSGDLDESGRREFDRWLRKSPEHVSAYLEVSAIWNEGSNLDPTRKWDITTLMAEARQDSDEVVSLSKVAIVREHEHGLPLAGPLQNVRVPEALSHRAQGHHPLAGRPFSRLISVHRSRSWRGVYAAAASVMLVAVACLWVWRELAAPVYATAVAEQRSLLLADGSTVNLNSRSKIRVRYSKGERSVDLIEGQALFHVAKDSRRPFVVSAEGTMVRAVGTQFDVYERHGGTVVTVVEGQVAVLTPVPTARTADAQPNQEPAPSSVGGPASAGARVETTLVSAGEQLTVDKAAARKSAHANVAAVTAWTEHRIVFESASLSEVAEEFNRYNERQLIVEDPQLYDFHISGVFSSTDPESLIRFLRGRIGIRVTETSQEIRISKNT